MEYSGVLFLNILTSLVALIQYNCTTASTSTEKDIETWLALEQLLSHE